MTDGLYKVHYETALGQGFGVATLLDGKIRGGDGAFYYSGPFTWKGDEFDANVVTGRFGDASTPSVFGKDDVHLALQGKSTNGSLSVTGHARRRPTSPSTRPSRKLRIDQAAIAGMFDKIGSPADRPGFFIPSSS